MLNGFNFTPPEDEDDRWALDGTFTRRDEELWMLNGLSSTGKGRSIAVRTFAAMD